MTNGKATIVCPEWCTTTHTSADEQHIGNDLATIDGSPNDGATVRFRFQQWDDDSREVELHIDNPEGLTNAVTLTADGARKAAAELSRLADQLG